MKYVANASYWKCVTFEELAVHTKFMRRLRTDKTLAVCGGELAEYEKRHDSVLCLQCGDHLPVSFVTGNPDYECVVQEEQEE